MADPLNVDEVARQVAEQVGLSISEAIQKVLTTQSNVQGNNQTSTQDRMGDIGGTERLEKDNMNESGIIFANQKRTADAYQNQELADAKSKDAIGLQALQNAITTADMMAKRTISGFEFADNKKWNINETDFIASNTLRSAVPQDAIAAMVVKAVNDALAKKE
jgi:hypothetical protein